MSHPPRRLSIVVITKDEESNIDEGLKTVIDGAANVPDAEILLVDSASTDATIEIAAAYPIHILQLSSENVLSPSSGRYVGTEHTDSEYVFFLDGDMTIDIHWLGKAIAAMDADARLAGVAGRCEEIVYADDGSELVHRKDRFVDYADRAVSHLGGSALYRRSVLEEVGGFNPHLANEEELELGLRIGAAGYELRRLDTAMSLHRTNYYGAETASLLTWSQIRRDWRNRRNVALGRVLRCVWRNPMRRVFLKLYRRELTMTAFFLGGLVLVPLAIVITPWLLVAWAAVLLGLISMRAAWKRDILDTMLVLAHHVSSAYGFTVGFITGAATAGSYQPKFVEVQ